MQSACAVLYCLWPVQLYHIFPHYAIKDMIFGKQVIEHEVCVWIYPTKFVGKFLTLRRIQRDIIQGC